MVDNGNWIIATEDGSVLTAWDDQCFSWAMFPVDKKNSHNRFSSKESASEFLAIARKTNAMNAVLAGAFVVAE